MAQNGRIDDAKRYTQRLWKYIPAFEEITKIIIESKSNEIDSLLFEMLPLLKEMFNSDIAFLTDQEGKIIKSSQGVSLEGKTIPKIVTDVTQSTDEPIFISNTASEHAEFKDLNIDSIMVLISLTKEKRVWIGVCNGKNDPEPYLSADKRIFKFIISFFHLIYKSGQESEEQKDCLKRYTAALYDGNLADLTRTSAELVIKYKYLNALPNFLDAALCETILKKSLHQENEKMKRGHILDLNKEAGNFKVGFFRGDEFLDDIEIPIKSNERVALACARGLLYDIFIGSVPAKIKDITVEATGPTIEEYKEWIETIVKLSDWEKGKEEKDFDYRIDWLRTQWLRIYYQSRSGSRHPEIQNGRAILRIYSKTWRKTVALIQEHLKGNPEETQDPGTIVINSDWLLAFLAQNALLSRNLAEHYRLIDPGSNDSNLLTGSRFFSHISRFILYILHYIRFARREAKYETEIKKTGQQGIFLRPPFADVPLTPGSSLSSSIIFMVSEYAYRQIGVPRELLIFEKLSQQLNFELPLYAANEFYRDHCYHVIDVCLLGEFLLSCDKPGPITKSGRNIFYEIDDHNRGDSLKNWYVAALCHDLGYVVERVEKLVGPIEKLKSDGLLQFNLSLKEGLKNGKKELKKDIDTLCQDKDLNIQDELKMIIEKRIETLDHGIIGWLYLCQILKKLEIPFSSMKPALTAILRHNLSDHDDNMHEELFSLLLILCDHLQEWGRPRVVTDQLATGVMEIMRFSPQESYFDRQVHLNQFSITGMILKNPEKKDLPVGICDKCINSSICNMEETCLRLRSSIQETGIEFRLVYHGDRIPDFEPVLSWLFFCHEFQCKKFPFGQYLFPIAIHFSHPPSTIPLLSEEGISELDIFEEFANTNEEAAYLCQWVECARKNWEGINYIREYDQKNGKFKDEEFIIHLERLGRPLSRGVHRQQVKDFIKWKKEWWAEKYISRDLGS